MSLIADIIARLVDARSNLSEDGFVEEAASLDGHISAVLDTLMEAPSAFISDPADPGHLVSAAFVTSVAVVRTASAGSKLSPAEWRQIRRRLQMHPPRAKRWLCCKKPEKRRTRKGQVIWGSVCQYRITSGKTAGKTMGTWIVLAKGQGKRPHATMIDGHRIKTCSAHAVTPDRNHSTEG